MTVNPTAHEDPPSPLANLLGPTEPEVDCEECFEQLDRYVELELAAGPADQVFPGVRAHLDGCQACREEHASLHALLDYDQADARR